MPVINSSIIMKKILLLVLFSSCALFCSAQLEKMPYWIHTRPQADDNAKYYFRVTSGEGDNYDRAYANAFAKAILESSWKLGVDVNTQDDLQTIEARINDNIKVSKAQMNLQINKVCEYSERLSGRMGIRVYILWQVAKYGNVNPNFEEFTKCKE